MTGDDDIESAMDDAVNAGGAEEMYKDLSRKAANFRGVEDQKDVEDALKDRRRTEAHKRRVSLRTAVDRAARRTSR